jgi:ferredoxin-NADP reductase
MAAPSYATVQAIETFAPDVRALVLAPEAPLGFVGGQFIIVDSGLVAPSGKAIKRAYSILSADADQGTFVLASKRLGAGLGSNYMHGLAVGDRIKFSGPWGKLLPPAKVAGRTLVLATDTGITATLGLLQAVRFAPFLRQTRFIWLRTDPSYFLPEDFVRARLPAALGSVEIDLLPPIDHPARLPHIQALLGADRAPGRFAHIFIAGDGTVNYALLDEYVAGGVVATRDNVESFFNYPKKTEAADVKLGALKPAVSTPAV